ncbi:hypothetical protein KUCAC02_013348, partial [Chaenocephalus aceratus]
KLFPFSFISALLSRHCDADAMIDKAANECRRRSCYNFQCVEKQQRLGPKALAECDSLRCEVLWRSPRCVGEDGGNEWLTGCQMMEALIQASPKQRLDGGVIHAEARPPRCLGA